MAKVRIVALSDTHARHREVTVPRGDILVHCGDFMNSGEDFREIIDFNFWLREQPVSVAIVGPGNHDLLFEKQPYFAQSFLSNAIYLRDSGVTSHGLTFWGCPYVPEFMGWGFMAPRGAPLKRHWDLVPPQLDVLVSHGPPHGYLDMYQGKHVGCEAQRDAIKTRKIRYNLFGHIHTGHGTARLGKTLLYNVAILDVRGRPRNPTVIDVTV